MHADHETRRIWIAGSAIDVWEHPDTSFSWSLDAIERYADREQWESVFNALVLLGDSEPKGVGA
jgi:hypothetical protein